MWCHTEPVEVVESLRGRMSESERRPVCDGAGVNGLSPALHFGDTMRVQCTLQFECMLAESFGEA